MKKLLSVVALLAVVGMVLLAGCEPKETTPAPDTNAPPAAPGGTNAPAK